MCVDKLGFVVPFFVRYVDDILTCIPKDGTDQILRVFNSFHPRLQLTSEIETNGCLPFLDTLVIRQNNSLIFDWFRKKTWSGRTLNHYSYHPMAMNIVIVINIVDRILLLSDKRFLKRNWIFARRVFLTNNYPPPPSPPNS